MSGGRTEHHEDYRHMYDVTTHVNLRNSVGVDVSELAGCKHIKELTKDMDTEGSIEVKSTVHSDTGFGRLTAVWNSLLRISDLGLSKGLD